MNRTPSRPRGGRALLPASTRPALPAPMPCTHLAESRLALVGERGAHAVGCARRVGGAVELRRVGRRAAGRAGGSTRLHRQQIRGRARSVALNIPPFAPHPCSRSAVAAPPCRRRQSKCWWRRGRRSWPCTSFQYRSRACTCPGCTRGCQRGRRTRAGTACPPRRGPAGPGAWGSKRVEGPAASSCCCALKAKHAAARSQAGEFSTHSAHPVEARGLVGGTDAVIVAPASRWAERLRGDRDIPWRDCCMRASSRRHGKVCTGFVTPSKCSYLPWHAPCRAPLTRHLLSPSHRCVSGGQVQVARHWVLAAQTACRARQATEHLMAGI